jgi:hypothetical protein
LYAEYIELNAISEGSFRNDTALKIITDNYVEKFETNVLRHDNYKIQKKWCKNGHNP